MSESGSTRIHETDFCARVASWADHFFSSSDSPFASAGIEGFGTGQQSRKRKDLRLYDRATGRLALCGEVRLPGAKGGGSPYSGELMEDAYKKADNAQVRYFFTWNVNVFVLFDRSRWDVPLVQRRIKEWRLDRYLRDAEAVGEEQNLEYLKVKFLPQLLLDLGRIYRGEQPDWPMMPDDVFIRSLESHLAWPIDAARRYLASEADRTKEFDRRLRDWMASQDWSVVRADREKWNQALDRTAQTLVHLLANRLIFYQALRARFADLPRLQLRGAKTAAEAYAGFQRLFERAVQRSGDYEPLFYPHEQDWAGRLVFEGQGALSAWRSALSGIEDYDFSRIGSDVVGKIFQRLVAPEERHRWGQHFTGDDVVDLINAFCIRDADGAVLDPACGSGSFLVRAYYRKRWLAPQKSHVDLLSELFGCDIAPYPAHLATLNLAAREINDEANYPRVRRGDFFNFDRSQPFCELPPNHTPILLPDVRSIIGNPPYVRQEQVGAALKAKAAKLLASRWPGLRLSGRSDEHCYFWPVAGGLLADTGCSYLGFLTSSSWLDVEYGFTLQRWILENFRLVAVMESTVEPWFPDARVKTCITILQRCKDPRERMETLTKFVNFKRPLAEIIGEPPTAIGPRFEAIDRLRQRIDASTRDQEDDSLRVIVKRQQDLWNEGVRALKSLPDAAATEHADGDEGNGKGGDAMKAESEERSELRAINGGGEGQLGPISTYVAGKWGRYLRAPTFYFDVMRKFGDRFVPLGQIAAIRFGVKTGCDAFFMPRDITTWALESFPSEREFKRRFRVARDTVATGKAKIVRPGDESEHAIETQYLEPEVHSPMMIDRPTISASDVDRLVLLVDKSRESLKGTLVSEYLRYGERNTFDSPVPIPQRSTCAARNPWYDLTKLVRPGLAFWPMAQQYRHIVASNPEKLICNHNLFDLSADGLGKDERRLLVAVLNSTLVGLFKTFYGRFAGTEGNLKTEVVDVKLLEIPDPRESDRLIAQRILDAFERMTARSVGRLVEEQLMECHSPEKAATIAEGPIVLAEELRQADRRQLDDAVFELLGVSDPIYRQQLVDQLYEATAAHFRQIRVVEIQKMEQRSKSGTRRITTDELARDSWDAVYYKDVPPISEWLATLAEQKILLSIPTEGAPRLVDEHSMFDHETVYFGREKNAPRLVCSSRAQAELIVRLVEIGFRGGVGVPESANACRDALEELNKRIGDARLEFEVLASDRVSDEKAREQIVGLLIQWLVHGKPKRRAAAVA